MISTSECDSLQLCDLGAETRSRRKKNCDWFLLEEENVILFLGATTKIKVQISEIQLRKGIACFAVNSLK